MAQTIKKPQDYVTSPLPAFSHVSLKADGKPSRMNLFPERLNHKINRAYNLISAETLSSEEVKELKLLLAEDRVLALHITQNSLNPSNWATIAGKPSAKILIKKAPQQSIIELYRTLEIALLMDNPPTGAFDLADVLAKTKLLSDALLIAVVGHPLMPQRLAQKFQERFENYVSAISE